MPSRTPSNKEKEANDDEDDSEEAVSYKPYRPLKVKLGRPHPDPVVENSTLAAVEPPDIVYNLAIPADVIAGRYYSIILIWNEIFGQYSNIVHCTLFLNYVIQR